MSKTFTQFRVDNVTTTIPTTLEYGQEVYYKDASGNLTLWVGHEDGTAWPAVGYKELTVTIYNDPNDDWAVGANYKSDFEVAPTIIQVLAGPTRVDVRYTNDGYEYTFGGGVLANPPTNSIIPGNYSSVVQKVPSFPAGNDGGYLQIVSPESGSGTSQLYLVNIKFYP
jgi:hypothetical protein